MFNRSAKVEVLSERTKIPSDGKTSVKICLRFTDDPGTEISLRLTRGGSFSAGEQVKEAAFTVINQEVNLKVYAPRRPGNSFLIGPGFRHRLDFVAASFLQGLIYEWVPTLFWALALALVLRSYAVASFYIPSGSMENTLLEGDLLIADKLSYKVLKHEPQRGDIMIFQFPENRKVDYIKRIIGLPGETVEVRGGVVFINGKPLSEDYIKEQPRLPFGPITVPEDGPPFQLAHSSVFAYGQPAAGSNEQEFPFLVETPWYETIRGHVALSEEQGIVVDVVLDEPRHGTIRVYADAMLSTTDEVATSKELMLATTQPRGMLNRRYTATLENLSAGDYIVTIYTIPEDSYFAMGDNRNESSDSRAWGFVPRDHVEGRALLVFFPLSRIGLIEHSESLPDAILDR